MPLEKFLESIESLPCDLQRIFNLIRELDTKVYNLKCEVNASAADFIEKSSTLTPQEKKARMKSLMESYDRMIQWAEEKKVLSHQSYNMVDKHICRLDQDLAIHAATESDTVDEDETLASSAPKRKKPNDKDTNAHKHKSKDTKARKGAEMPSRSNGDDPRIHIGPYNYDMDVDPNEPTYCICGKVSFGNMIACDNNDCAIEWFHYQCVNITSTPKGKWYCPDCWNKRANTKETTGGGAAAGTGSAASCPSTSGAN